MAAVAERIGFLAGMRLLLGAPVERALREAQSARHDRLSYEAANRILSEAARLAEPEEGGWTPIGGLGKRQLDEGDRTTLLEQARKFAAENPHAIGYLGTLRRFVLGQGAQVHIVHEDDQVKQAADAWFAEFHHWNRWDVLEDEIPMRSWRDGEVFVRRFDDPAELTVSKEVLRLLARFNTTPEELAGKDGPPEGMIFLRLIAPEAIADPSGAASEGIITPAADVCTVLGYCYCPDGARVSEIVPADEIEHVKLGVDSDVKRGRSILAPLMKRLKQYEDWLTYRILLNLARTAVVLIKKVTGSPGQVAAVRDAQEKTREDGRNDQKTKALKPMTTVHAGPGIEYEFKSPNINAPDAKDDGRAILLTIAAATGLAEYMVTGDASNANFASTMVAESPAVREFEDWQDFFTPIWTRIHRWALVAGAEAGAIKGLSTAQAQLCPIAIEWPPLLARDEQKHTEANQVRFKNGILSREGWSRDDGLDVEVEKERLKREASEVLGLPIDLVLDQLAKAVTAGVLTLDPALEAWLRKRLGVPALVEEPELEGDEVPPPAPGPRRDPPPPESDPDDEDQPRESKHQVDINLNVQTSGKPAEEEPEEEPSPA